MLADRCKHRLARKHLPHRHTASLDGPPHRREKFRIVGMKVPRVRQNVEVRRIFRLDLGQLEKGIQRQPKMTPSGASFDSLRTCLIPLGMGGHPAEAGGANFWGQRGRAVVARPSCFRLSEKPFPWRHAGDEAFSAARFKSLWPFMTTNPGVPNLWKWDVEGRAVWRELDACGPPQPTNTKGSRSNCK